MVNFTLMMKIQVIAHPHSQKAKVSRDLQGRFHVYITKSPQKGQANQAIIELLAVYFQLKKNQIILKTGAKSKSKVFELM